MDGTMKMIVFITSTPTGTNRLVAIRPMLKLLPQCQQTRSICGRHTALNVPARPRFQNQAHRFRRLDSSFRTSTRLYSTDKSSSTPPPSPNQHDATLEPPPPNDLPSARSSRQSAVSQRLIRLMDQLQASLFSATRRLNDLTGYTSIERLKARISTLEESAGRTRAAVRSAKAAYTSAISSRSSSQREVNELLQRKHAWTPADLERFTALYRSDHANEQAEAAAADALARAENEAEETAAALTRSILNRYHEEQIWSDKIRKMSTWGTWGLMGVNILLFVVFQVVVEPWRRKRLVTGFEEKVKEAIEGERDAGAISTKRAAVLGLYPADSSPSSSLPSRQDEAPLDTAPSVLSPADTLLDDDASTSTSPSSLSSEAARTLLSNGGSSNTEPSLQVYRAGFKHLFSEVQVSVRMLDLTTLALEGVAFGAGAVGLACFVFLRRS
ncbi:MAG: hypothetical protein M1825_002477 [Sarcosagium campestre]|nr:MAG: hypothetical protein M1825_002477 [Sarcosagium campestre]